MFKNPKIPERGKEIIFKFKEICQVIYFISLK